MNLSIPSLLLHRGLAPELGEALASVQACQVRTEDDGLGPYADIHLFPEGSAGHVEAPPGAPPPLALWVVTSADPVLEVQATRAGMHGVLLLAPPGIMEQALQLALAQHRRRAPAPELGSLDTELGWDRPVRWRWNASNDAVVIDAHAPIPIDRTAMRHAIAQDITHQRTRNTHHFFHRHHVHLPNEPVVIEVAGAGVQGRGAHAAMQGTVTVSRAATVAHTAATDPLTTMPSREAFLLELDRHHARVDDAIGRHAVICLDLDNLQAINDALGHRTGDLLIKWAADRIRTTLGTGFAARVGSDEFAIVVPASVTGDAADTMCRRVLDGLTSSVSLDGHLIYASAKAGIAWHRDDHRNGHDVLRDAQSALTHAKSLRSARLVHFRSDMRADHMSALKLDRDLRAAVANRSFELHFQPIASLQTGMAAGFEALVRWRHPELGLVPPSTFIPQAERTGLILPIGLWVLDEALRGLKSLHKKHPELRDTYVTVNVAPQQIHQADFVRLVLRKLDAHGLSPAKLRLEITEDSAMSDAEASIEVLNDLRAAGIQILLDDFGTGYSALHYLVRLPADVVKVDRMFVDGIGSDARKTRVITTIVNLADSLGMRLVAEGVETADQVAWLTRLGFQNGQGYFFARPMPWQDVGRLAGQDLRRPEAPRPKRV